MTGRATYEEAEEGDTRYSDVDYCMHNGCKEWSLTTDARYRFMKDNLRWLDRTEWTRRIGNYAFDILIDSTCVTAMRNNYIIIQVYLQYLIGYLFKVV